MERKFATLDELFNAFHITSPEKFADAAELHGFGRKEGRDYIKNTAVHDMKVPTPKWMHIVSPKPGGYQFDTFINNKKAGGLNYLMFINVNTRKAYAYPIQGKGAKAVKAAFEKFFAEVPNVSSLTSDQDAAYLGNEVSDFILSKNIPWTTTTDNNHNVLGIINRFMKTVRQTFYDKKKISPEEMADFLHVYNNIRHNALKFKKGKRRNEYLTPNKMTPEYEERYIKERTTKENPYNFQPGDKVRLVQQKSPFGKNRKNVSDVAYIVEGKDGNQFQIRSEDYSVDSVPGYRLIKTDDPKIKIAGTLNDGKRGIVSKIMGHNGSKYKIVYEGGAKDAIFMKNMREGNPNKLSRMELEYWSKKRIKYQIQYLNEHDRIY